MCTANEWWAQSRLQRLTQAGLIDSDFDDWPCAELALAPEQGAALERSNVLQVAVSAGRDALPAVLLEVPMLRLRRPRGSGLTASVAPLGLLS